MKEVDYLADWLIRYLKNRDIFYKKIKQINYKEGVVKSTEKTKTVTYYIVGFNKNLKELIKTIKPDENCGLVFYNNEENLKKILELWSEIIRVKQLIVYFVNPFSKLDKKWVIYPYTHNKVSDDSSLNLGLVSLFESVEPLSKDELNKILN